MTKKSELANAGDRGSDEVAPVDRLRQERQEIAAENRKNIQALKLARKDFDDNNERVCIMFADLVGSTKYKHQRSAIEGVAKSFEHNSGIERIVESAKWNGEVVKFLGDGVMAYFAETRASAGDAARRCAGATLEIIEEFDKYNLGIPQAEWPNRIATKIGIHYGPVWMLKFRQGNCVDPHGTTVDVAARLCEIAPQMNVVMTEETYKAAAASEIKDSKWYGPEKRRLKGVKEPLNLYAGTIGRDAASEIPLPGCSFPPFDDVSVALKSASTLFFPNDASRSDVHGAADIYRRILKGDPSNFHANYRLAELLGLHYHNGDHESHKARGERLDEAFKCICEAKGERPQACYVWKLLSWILYQRFVLECDEQALCQKPPCRDYLRDAVRYATHALKIAEGCMDEYGAAIAKIFLIVYLHERIRCQLETAEADRQLATRYLEECQYVFDRGLGNSLHSMYCIVKAKAIYTSNPKDREKAINLAVEALRLNNWNRLATEFIQSLQQ